MRSEVRGIWFDLVTAIPAPHDEANTCGSRGTEGHSETNGPLYPHGPAAGGPQGALVRIDLTGGSGIRTVGLPVGCATQSAFGGELFDLYDRLGARPVNAAEDERRSEAAGVRRQHLERHLGGGQRLQAASQPPELRLLDAGAGAAGIDKVPLRIVVWPAAARRARGGTFRIGPGDDHEFPRGAGT